MTSKIRENGRAVKVTWRDLTVGANLWNGTREMADWLAPGVVSLRTSRLTTRENPVIQPPASASAAVTTWGQSTSRVLV